LLHEYCPQPLPEVIETFTIWPDDAEGTFPLQPPKLTDVALHPTAGAVQEVLLMLHVPLLQLT
jgi:hypothetical protein